MMHRMKSHYTVAEFAELADVTVKALHLYDRLGLLRPRRSNAGYRLYVSRDLERLEQIVALKSSGLRLEQIRVLLERDSAAVADVLRVQRQTLERKREELDRVIRAIEQVEASVTSPSGLSCSPVLNRLIEAIDMQNDVDAMKRFFKTDAAWNRARPYLERWPGEPWRDLFRDVQASLHEDPASDHARSLGTRWDVLFRADTNGDFAFRAGLWRSWLEYEQWPKLMKQRVAKFNFVALWKFIAEIAWARVGADGRFPDAAPGRAPDRVSASKINLFRAIAESLDSDPSGDHTQQLIAEWRALRDQEVGDDAATNTGLLKTLANPDEWPAGFRRYVASLYDMPVETWTKVADALVRRGGIDAGHVPT
jgi:MerR family transcriptional regulator, thiopeptide resistance regulator